MLCIYVAIKSFPTPVSPKIKTEAAHEPDEIINNKRLTKRQKHIQYYFLKGKIHENKGGQKK